MSVPALCRRSRPAPRFAVDETELSRFRGWLDGRGYAAGTARLWANRVRAAYALGATSPDEVDAIYRNLSHSMRVTTRQALREFIEFRGSG